MIERLGDWTAGSRAGATDSPRKPYRAANPCPKAIGHRRLHWCLTAVLIVAGAIGAAESPAEAPKDIRLPPVFFPSDECRRRLPELVKEDPEAQRAFKPLREKADAALKIPPSPLEKIVYEWRVESDPERVRTLRSLEDMERL